VEVVEADVGVAVDGWEEVLEVLVPADDEDDRK
jgi:hypothetical protein